MSILRATPYNLVLGQSIDAKVEAKNVIGFSDPSNVSLGNAKLRTQPLTPSHIVERVENGTTDTSIRVYYQMILSEAESGGSPVLSLEL
jgi:hypothetical protein